MNQSAPEPQVKRALLEIAHSCRSLIGRCNGISDLGAATDPMNHLVQNARNVSRHLQTALSSLSMLERKSGSLKLETANSKSGHETIVARCVSNLLNDLDFPEADDDDWSKPGNTAQRVDFKGLSWSIPITHLLTFLEGLGKTGMLQISTFEENFTLLLDGGEVIHASTDNSPPGLRLGEVLVSQGALTEGKLAKFVRDFGHRENFMGTAIVEEGYVTEDQLREALEYQVQALFQRIFVTEDSAFSFYEGRKSTASFGVNMKLTRLLLESAIGIDNKDRADATGAVAPEATESEAAASDEAEVEAVEEEATDAHAEALQAEAEETGAHAETSQAVDTEEFDRAEEESELEQAFEDELEDILDSKESEPSAEAESKAEEPKA